MKRVVVFLATVGSLMASNIVISTGSPSGVYSSVGKKIASQIGGAKVISSKGSIENIENILSGKAQAAIVQKDALRYYTSKHPAVETKIEYIGDIYKECAFLVVRKDGKVSSDADLQSKGVKVGVGQKGSGTAVTWAYLTQLEPNFKKATPVPVGGIRALAKVASGALDAMLFTSKPQFTKPLFKTVNSNPSLEFAPIKDWDLNDKFEGKPVYKFEEVQVRDSFFGNSVDTICTTASVITTSKLPEGEFDLLSDIVLNYKNFIIQ